jgi:cytidylate kinase
MYRAVALVALRANADLSDGEELGRLAREMDLDVGDSVSLGDEDISSAIRTGEIDAAVPYVARQPAVRQELVRRQRAWADAHGGGVVEGRDIASVVFPDAMLKIYLTASPHERAKRRARERVVDEEPGSDELHATKASIDQRDEIDSTRDTSPLVIANGATVIDSTGLSVDDVVSQIVAML